MKRGKQFTSMRLHWHMEPETMYFITETESESQELQSAAAMMD